VIEQEGRNMADEIREGQAFDPANPSPAAGKTTDGLAITSLILGILSLFCLSILTGIPALILGIVSLKKIDRTPNLQGRGMAIAGIVLGGVSFILFLPIMAGFMIPTMMMARGKAEMVKCQSNLREIQNLGLLFADTGNNRFYPWSEKGGIASLQVLVDSTEGLRPGMFICPASRDDEMAERVDGKFQLDVQHCSYDMVPWRLSPSDEADSIFAFDREPWHRGSGRQGRNVVFIDSSVEFMTEDQFEDAYEKDRKRYEWRKPK
jgi:hypothetical protein